MLVATLTLASVLNCIGIGLQLGTHPRWRLVANDGTGAPTLTDMGASFAIATGGVLTLFIAAPPNGSAAWCGWSTRFWAQCSSRRSPPTCPSHRSSRRPGY